MTRGKTRGKSAGPTDETRVALTELQIEQIANALRAGKRLPPHLFPLLFEAPKEYRLTYAGKARRADVLAETMAVPLQPARTYGGDGAAWTNMLVFGDNLQVLRTLLDLKYRGELRNADGSEGIRLCYIDPPFATRREFVGSRDERAYEDRVEGAEFVEVLRRRLILIHELLTDDGSLYLHLDQRKLHAMKLVLDEVFGEARFRNEIIWKRTSAHNDPQRFGVNVDYILFYSKGPNPLWNQQYATHDEEYLARFSHRDPDGRKWSDYDLTAKGLSGGGYRYTYKGVANLWRCPPETMERLDRNGRLHFTRKGGIRLKRYLDENKGVPLQALWTDIPPINSQAKERLGFPTQKPKELVERIVDASTRPGDIVLDCFVGSGTTLEAAGGRADGARRWIGIDSSKFAIYQTQARLLRAAGKKKPRPEDAFTLYNAGLYDYQALRELPWDEYKSFVLQLFQCRPHEENLGGVTFHGSLGDNHVLVYDFKDHPNARIGEAFVHDLADVCGSRLGERCFIVAPAVSVEPYEDYLDIEGTRFFFLRIPYSIIAELHRRAFTELAQPTSVNLLNSTIEAVGFDFVTPPRVEARYVRDASGVSAEVLEFESEAYAATESGDDVANLAMIMVDRSYDDDVFDLDDVFYSEDLAKKGWKISFAPEDVGETMMFVYLDVFGNEHRERKTLGEFALQSPGRRKKTTAKEITGKKVTAKKATATPSTRRHR